MGVWSGRWRPVRAARVARGYILGSLRSPGVAMLAGLWMVLHLLLMPALAQVPAGQKIDEAIVIGVSPDGFDALTGFGTALIPPRLDLPDIEGSCAFTGARGRGFWIEITTDTLELVPDTDQLLLSAAMRVRVNAPSDKFFLEVPPFCADCNGWITEFPMSFQASIGFTTNATTGLPEAFAGPVTTQNGMQASDFQATGAFCVIDNLDFLIQIMIGEVNTAFEDTIAALMDEAVLAVNDGMLSLVTEEPVDIAEGAVATLATSPEEIVVTPAGMEIILGASMTAEGEPAACIAEFDPGSSAQTLSLRPAVGSGGEHYGAVISDEFVNQLLYATWRLGLFCLDPSDSDTLDVGIPFDTTLLPLFSGQVFTDLFPTAEPLALGFVAQAPPEVDLRRTEGIGLALDDVALNLYAELDGRQVRLAGMLMDVNVGADLPFDATTGVLGLELDLDGTPEIPVLIAEVVHNDLKPGQDDEIVAAVSGLLESTLVSAIIDSFLGAGLGYAMPSYCAFGVTDADLTGVGADTDWLATYAWAGDVTYVGLGGCVGDSASGCGTDTGATGCDSPEEALGCTSTVATGDTGMGCDPETCDPAACADTGGGTVDGDLCGCSVSGSLQQRVMMLLVAGTLVLVRRRRRE